MLRSTSNSNAFSIWFPVSRRALSLSGGAGAAGRATSTCTPTCTAPRPPSSRTSSRTSTSRRSPFLRCGRLRGARPVWRGTAAGGMCQCCKFWDMAPAWEKVGGDRPRLQRICGSCNGCARLQAGQSCVCRSQAWDAKIVTSAWWVHFDQVCTQPSGHTSCTACCCRHSTLPSDQHEYTALARSCAFSNQPCATACVPPEWLLALSAHAPCTGVQDGAHRGVPAYRQLHDPRPQELPAAASPGESPPHPVMPAPSAAPGSPILGRALSGCLLQRPFLGSRSRPPISAICDGIRDLLVSRAECTTENGARMMRRSGWRMWMRGRHACQRQHQDHA